VSLTATSVPRIPTTAVIAAACIQGLIAGLFQNGARAKVAAVPAQAAQNGVATAQSRGLFGQRC